MRIKKILAMLLTIIICFSVATSAPAADRAEDIKQKLTFSTLSAQPINSVTDDFILPFQYEGAYILWTSDNENVISVEGEGDVLKAKVYRPPFGEGLVSATLTANITLNDEVATKRFLVRVLEKDIGFTYSQTVLQAYNNIEMEFLSSQNVFAITGDLILPEKPEGGKVQVSFTSENPSVITDEGKVNRNFDSDQIAVFTITYKENFETLKVSYPITVKAYTDDEIKNTAKNDLNEVINKILNRYNCQSLDSDIQLPSKGSGGTDIKWETSDSSVITAGGRITRGDTSKNAVLTATGTFYEAVEVQTIDIMVERIIKGTAPIPPISGGGGGGGVYTPPEDNVPPVITPPVNNKRFKDVSETHFAFDAIGFLAEKDVINGLGEDMFAPDSPVTREQALKIILLGLGVEVENKGDAFADVEEDGWYAPYIKTAKNLKIVNGISKTKFGVGLSITRQDLSVIIYTAAKQQGREIKGLQTINFSDIDSAADYAKEALAVLGDAGIINGRDGKFYPHDSATRAELSVMLYRMLTNN